MVNFVFTTWENICSGPGVLIIGGEIKDCWVALFATSETNNLQELAKEIVNDHRDGCYIRVLQEENGLGGRLSYRGWSKARCDAINKIPTDNLRFFGIPVDSSVTFGYRQDIQNLQNVIRTFCKITD